MPGESKSGNRILVPPRPVLTSLRAPRLNAQKLHLWADSEPAMYDAQESERTWSPEYFKHWFETAQAGSLGAIPVLVLMRAEGGYGDDLDVPAPQLETERKQSHAHLAALSTRGQLQVVRSGHNMQVEVPLIVSRAIQRVIASTRKRPM